MHFWLNILAPIKPSKKGLILQQERTQKDIKIQSTSGAGTPKRGESGRTEPQKCGDNVGNQRMAGRVHQERDGRIQAQSRRGEVVAGRAQDRAVGDGTGSGKKKNAIVERLRRQSQGG